MPYPMAEQDRELQARARAFVDGELIPHEVEAELNDGVLPREVVERHRRIVRELGFGAITMPKELGGDGLTMF
ncbi:MAG TPA: acyl-CoA dehydrogenase family protein, partial [Actinomycetota bacterium]|nr:acyl-CoA dehydrogenase family protein [Actinomycetota bacterium]